MKVLLIQRVEKLGDVGDVVAVADGYARNFLLPRKLAVEPTEHNLRQYAKFRQAREEERKSREQKAKELKERLQGLVLKFVREAHDEQLYGSVRKEEIAERIKEEFGAEIEKGRIALEQPLDKVGVYPVKIELYGDISVEIQVEVAAEEGLPSSDEQPRDA
jgi:large subunit ribosomal protein L9